MHTDRPQESQEGPAYCRTILRRMWIREEPARKRRTSPAFLSKPPTAAGLFHSRINRVGAEGSSDSKCNNGRLQLKTLDGQMKLKREGRGAGPLENVNL